MTAKRGAPLILLAAGGTGGHLFPAEALARGARAQRHRGRSRDRRPGRALRQEISRRAASMSSPSETVRGRDPISLARTAAVLGIGSMQALRLLGRIKPRAVVGFGGYPTVPPVLAATLRGIPTLIHEQNAVMGRANRLLARRVERNRARLCRRARARAAARRQIDPDRQSGAAAGDRGGGDALSWRRTSGPLASHRVRRQPGCAHHGRHRAACDRAARTHLQMRLSIVQQAREEDLERVQQRLCARASCVRNCAVLHRSAGADRGGASRRRAFRRVDRGRARRDRAARHPGAAAACARSGPVRQCRRAGTDAGAAIRLPSGRIHARSAGG